jgi:hypothetical protein
MKDIQKLQQILCSACEALEEFSVSVDRPVPPPALFCDPSQKVRGQPTFEVGDIVTVRSGGFNMTIAEISPTHAGVIWTFPNSPALYRDCIPLASLTYSINKDEER